MMDIHFAAGVVASGCIAAAVFCAWPLKASGWTRFRDGISFTVFVLVAIAAMVAGGLK